MFDTLMVILKDFFEKVNLKKKNPQTTKKHAKLPSMQRVKGKKIVISLVNYPECKEKGLFMMHL